MAPTQYSWIKPNSRFHRSKLSGKEEESESSENIHKILCRGLERSCDDKMLVLPIFFSINVQKFRRANNFRNIEKPEFIFLRICTSTMFYENLVFKRSALTTPPPKNIISLYLWAIPLFDHFKSHDEMLKSYTVDFTVVKCYNNICVRVTWRIWKLTCIRNSFFF